MFWPWTDKTKCIVKNERAILEEDGAFHVVHRKRTAANCTKMKRKACQTFVFHSCRRGCLALYFPALDADWFIVLKPSWSRHCNHPQSLQCKKIRERERERQLPGTQVCDWHLSRIAPRQLLLTSQTWFLLQGLWLQGWVTEKYTNEFSFSFKVTNMTANKVKLTVT